MRGVLRGKVTVRLFLVLHAILVVTKHGKSDENLLHEAVQSHESAISGIRTLYAKVHRKIIPASAPDNGFAFSGEYWKEPGLVRVRQLGDDGRVWLEFSESNGLQKTVSDETNKKGKSASLLITPEAAPTIDIDVWKLALLGLPTFDAEPKMAISLSDAMKSMNVRKVEREGELVRVSLAKANESYDIWLDPRVNWLFSRVVRHVRVSKSQTDERRNEYRVTGFAEVQQGVFFPVGVELEAYVDDKLSVTNKTRFDAVAINDLKQPPFAIALPAIVNMRVNDKVKGLSYSVDQEGKKLAASTKVLRDYPTKGDLRYIAPSSARWFSPWYFVLFLAILSAMSVHLYRRRKVRRNESSTGNSTGE